MDNINEYFQILSIKIIGNWLDDKAHGKGIMM